jgi:HEAT repeat protein
MPALWLLVALLATPTPSSPPTNALHGLAGLDAVALQAARKSGLAQLGLEVALDPKQPFEDRVLGIRAVALLRGPADALAQLIGPDTSPEGVALAREAARTLAILGRTAQLSGALQHADPEIRARAAALGVGGPLLCAALNDPWPMVRRAAAQGLGAQPAHAACLATALEDPKAPVVTAAVQAIARAGLQGLVPQLRAIAGNARAPVALRVDTVLALGRLGDLEPAGTILDTHLSKGGIVPLANGAVRAFCAAGGAPATAQLTRALQSPAANIRVVAAEGLARLEHESSVPALRALLANLRGHHRARVQAAIERLAPAADDPANDPAANDPE